MLAHLTVDSDLVVTEYKDLVNCRSNLSIADKKAFHNADRDFFDVDMTRTKTFKNMMVVVCNTNEEPICIVRIGNFYKKAVETHPFSMKFEQITKIENVTLQELDCQTDQDHIIGKMDEYSSHEHFTVWNDFENHHLRNLELKLSNQMLSKMVKMALKLKEQMDGLRIRNSKWIPRRKILKENAALKRDSILKVDVSNIQVNIFSESGVRFSITIGNINKEPQTVFKPVVNMLEVSNLTVNFSSPQWNIEQERELTLVSLPKVILKKSYCIKNSPV